MARWKHENPTPKTAYMREWLETDKGLAHRKKHAEYMKEYRRKNRDKDRANRKRYYDKMRYECLKHYAGGEPECKCCGEKEILFLHLDHIEGNGAEHRRQLKAEIGYYPGGNNLPLWLKKNGYPEGFQVLCANCNLGKRIGKLCPHQLKLNSNNEN